MTEVNGSQVAQKWYNIIMSISSTSFKKGHKINNGREPWNKGKKMSVAHIKVLSEAKKRNPTRYWFGKKRSPKTIEKMKTSLKGKKAWNKGIGTKTPQNKKIRMSIEFRLWREAVFARDNWTCQKTGIRGDKLHPHHIQNFAQFPELRFAIDNGITLSEEAHKEFHKKYGQRNNTRSQLEEFLAMGEALKTSISTTKRMEAIATYDGTDFLTSTVEEV